MNEDIQDGFYFMMIDRDDTPSITRDLVRVEYGIPRNEAGKAVRQSRYGKAPTPATTEDVCALWPRFAAKELNQLRKWKASAMAVEAEWDEQAIARMLGAQLGESTRVAIQREVPKLVERVKRFESIADAMAAELNRQCDDDFEHTLARKWRLEKTKEAKP